MDVFEEFSKSIGLSVNPAKCKVYFGNVDVQTKQSIQELTNFSEGLLSFRYIGVPLTSPSFGREGRPFVENSLFLGIIFVPLGTKVVETSYPLRNGIKPAGSSFYGILVAKEIAFGINGFTVTM
ncbi:hypothetical protein KIW84_072754 [Lathyrus oleraceus]|uniref:Uncharacterized protein n=1 Tax=Pisum sativum TaxID=3888 RepID=A0A9D4VLU9_PEA|nr:hypothetical protein KIW84_072754 [Pisum sativum]